MRGKGEREEREEGRKEGIYSSIHYSPNSLLVFCLFLSSPLSIHSLILRRSLSPLPPFSFCLSLLSSPSSVSPPLSSSPFLSGCFLSPFLSLSPSLLSFSSLPPLFHFLSVFPSSYRFPFPSLLPFFPSSPLPSLHGD